MKPTFTVTVERVLVETYEIDVTDTYGIDAVHTAETLVRRKEVKPEYFQVLGPKAVFVRKYGEPSPIDEEGQSCGQRSYASVLY